MDNRHLERIKIVQNLFSASFEELQNNQLHENNELTRDILANSTRIDEIITASAPKYPVNRIAKADLAILRLAIYELIIKPVEPYKVVINEAVELAKEFAGERSYAFVNAVLGSVVTNYIEKHE